MDIHYRWLCLLLLWLGMYGCGGANLFVSKLEVISANPQAGETNVPSNTEITLKLAEALDPDSVNSETVHLMPVDEVSMADSGHMEMSSDALPEVVSAGIVYDASAKQIKIFPRVALNDGVTYRVHFSGVRMDNGRRVSMGVHLLSYQFTIAHTHEIQRERYHQQATKPFEFIESKYAFNKRLSEQSEFAAKNSNGGLELLKQRYYDTTLPTGESVILYEIDSDGLLTRYQKSVTTKEGEILVEYQSEDGDEFNVVQWWSSPSNHRHHQITKHYVPENSQYITEIDIDNPGKGFVLNHVLLQEVNHNLDLPENGMYPHRQITYSDLGDDGVIDYNSQGNPQPVNDRVLSWQTREYLSGRRQYDWTWMGNVDMNNNPTGFDVQFSEQDIATDVVIHEYDDLKRRVKHMQLSKIEGMSRQQWLSLINSEAVDSLLEAWVEISYDLTTGNRSEMLFVEKCKANIGVCPGYNGIQGFFLAQRSIFQSN